MVPPGAQNAAQAGRRLRVGFFEDLTTKLLTHGLEKAASNMGTRRCEVSEVRELLERGELDVGLLPAWDFLHINNLELIQGTCISMAGPGNILLLCSKVLPTEIRTVLVDYESFGARSLLHILLPSQTATHPQIRRSPVPLDPARYDFMNDPHDAFLLVGDHSLRIKKSAFAWVWDLSAAWSMHANTPLVLHVWCCRKGLALRDLEDGLASTARQNFRSVGEIAEKEAERLRAPADILKKLITSVFRVEGGPQQVAGLRLYLRELVRAKLLDKPRQFMVHQDKTSSSHIRMMR